MRFSRIRLADGCNSVASLPNLAGCALRLRAVSRWAPDARERLEAAAFELFRENGYEHTSVAQIADRAGLNRATFFRHYADKREVLFGGEDVLATRFSEGIRTAAAGASLVECLQSGFRAVGEVMTAEERPKAAQRVAALATNTDVQERALLKHVRTARSITAALLERGVDELTARLGSEVTMIAFSIAVQQWLTSDDAQSFSDNASAALTNLQQSARALLLDANPPRRGTTTAGQTPRRPPPS